MTCRGLLESSHEEESGARGVQIKNETECRYLFLVIEAPYLENSNLPEEQAYKKIKLSKLIFANKKKDGGEELVFSNNSPFMEVVSTLFKKLKKFNKHGCFGKNIESPLEAAKSTVMYGNPDQISKKLREMLRVGPINCTPPKNKKI